MLEVLPIEVIEIIATDNSTTWFKCLQLCKYFITHFSYKTPELKEKFLIKITTDNDWKIKYILPNKNLYTIHNPCISNSGHFYWFKK